MRRVHRHFAGFTSAKNVDPLVTVSNAERIFPQVTDVAAAGHDKRSLPAALPGFSHPIGVGLRVAQVSEQVPAARGVLRWVDPNEVNGDQPDDDETGSNDDARALHKITRPVPPASTRDQSR